MQNVQLQFNYAAPFNHVAEIEIIYKSKVNPADRPQVISSRQVYENIIQCYDLNRIEHKEFFYVMFLNRANKILGVCLMSEGGLTGTIVDVRHVMQAALQLNACSIILSHNHPSGVLSPSNEDVAITSKIKAACKLFDITLLDHLIVVSGNSYYSFADESNL